MSVTVFFNWIFDYSGRRNHVRNADVPVAPLQFKFFEYFLQRYLGVCFDTAWPTNGQHRLKDLFQQLLACLTIFSHDDVENRGPLPPRVTGLSDADFLDGSELLTKYPPYYERFYNTIV
jgi:hypothetical protein